MGYGTPAHQAGLLAAGPCVHHRRSFAPVSQLALGLVEGGTAPPRERALALATASAPANDGAPRR